MKRALILCLLFLTASAFAQEKNPVTSVLKEILPRQQKNLIAAAEAMPADKYAFKPTPAQMSFAHLVVHMTKSNLELCAKAGESAPPPRAADVNEAMPKDKLVSALKTSFDFCDMALAHADDSHLGDPIEVFGHQGPRAFAYFALTNDWADHYSAAAMYLRLNNILPPTAQPKK
ncbi:MAG TPA: DinB family protein [Terriglobales bacterium]|nr:DinB family protein [Terriglobales bacterium]